ncbi:hypothetical protein EBI_27421 [Enterocytozoon bieneusi H348]|nr:hypothetical protein EBI_27421 [Enterocytozoon bieneusi H348]|eukprot:XP_002649356.1 hypothetical protein EBI_27421 [Enterocytozoon bieneusi H348]
MRPCVYTQNLLGKKNKKWYDGYIIISKNKIILYNEKREPIYKSNKYILEQNNILKVYDYIIELETELILENSSGDQLYSIDKPNGIIVSNHNNNVKNKKQPKSDITIIKGRSYAEILDILKIKKNTSL